MLLPSDVARLVLGELGRGKAGGREGYGTSYAGRKDLWGQRFPRVGKLWGSASRPTPAARRRRRRFLRRGLGRLRLFVRGCASPRGCGARGAGGERGRTPEAGAAGRAGLHTSPGPRGRVVYVTDGRTAACFPAWGALFPGQGWDQKRKKKNKHKNTRTCPAAQLGGKTFLTPFSSLALTAASLGRMGGSLCTRRN